MRVAVRITAVTSGQVPGEPVPVVRPLRRGHSPWFRRGLRRMQRALGIAIAVVSFSAHIGWAQGPPDTDGDGMPDDWEVLYGFDPAVAAAPDADFDGDGLFDVNEYGHGTDPTNADTDGDWMGDGAEVDLGTDPLAPQSFLNSNCTVSVRNRTVRVKDDGSWLVGNVPGWVGRQVGAQTWEWEMGPIRARVVCADPVFGVYGAYSNYVTPAAGGETLHVSLGTLGPMPATVQILNVSAPVGPLNGTGATAQLAVTGTLSDSSTATLTAQSTGTRYVSSNPAIATVSADGLVTAGATGGPVIISVSNDGKLTTMSLTVSMDGDSDGDQMPDDWEVLYGLNPNSLPSQPDWDGDLDGDGLNNRAEYFAGTNPAVPDTDGDGLSDYDEDQTYNSNPLLADTDGDGVLDGLEGTGDSDGDGVLFEDDGLVVVDEDAVFEVPAHGPRQDHPLEVAAFPRQVFHRVPVRGADDVLFDDRTVVEFGRRVVRRGADQFDPALVGLLVRFPPRKRRQKRVVDVDDAGGVPRDKRFGQDLHVACEHDQVDPQVLQQRQLLPFLRGLGLLRDGIYPEVDTELRRDRGEGVVVAQDYGNLAVEFPRAVPPQQIVQAMILARHEHRHALDVRAIGEAPLHPQPVRDLGDAVFQ